MKRKCPTCQGSGTVNEPLPAKALRTNYTDAELCAKRKNWHHSSESPKKIGVYKTATMSTYHYGYGYSYWNGDDWGDFLNWGGSHGKTEFLWSGNGAKRNLPITDKKILTQQY